MIQAFSKLRPRLAADDSLRILDAAGLQARASAWDDLVGRAVEPNPHFSRHVIEAHLTAGLARNDLQFVTVWSGDRLDAVLPYRMSFDITGFGASVAQPFLTPFMHESAPLIAGDRFEPTLDAMIAGLAEASGGRAWRWPLLPTDRRVGSAMLGAMRRNGWAVAQVEAFERPILDRRASLDAFHQGHPNKSRLKDLRRRERRLAEAGAPSFQAANEGTALDTIVEAFLELEAAGWKGKSGTAFKSRPQTLSLARAMFSARPSPVSVRADMLSLDGRPLAISLALVAGGSAALLKTAYDESQRALAPGLLLEAEIIRAMHETAFADRLDSATLPGSALESLYRERETISEIIAVPAGGEGLLSVERRVRLARIEHLARSEAKRVLRRR